MSKQNMSAWFFEGGAVTIPKNLLGLMEPLGLTFEDLGRMVYLLYCGTDQIMNDDHYAVEAARALHSKGIVDWQVDKHCVDFSPMFDKIGQNLGEQPVYVAQAGYTADELNYADYRKKFEQAHGRFLSMTEQRSIQEAVQRYNWSYELTFTIFDFYLKNSRRHSYDFAFFCQMAFGAKVTDQGSFEQFTQRLESTTTKVIEVLKRLGKYNNPTEAQKEMYLKWQNSWKLSHELILLAADSTINAANPSFGYMDAILQQWQELGLTTPEMVQAYKDDQQKEKQHHGQPPRQKNKKTSEENFASQKRDLNSLIE